MPCIVLIAGQAHALVIASQLGNTPSANVLYYGQGVVVPVGGPWHNILFNFDSASGGPTTPYAAGDLFILTSMYFGTPTDLSNATAGFVGMSNGISGGMWTFDSSVVLSGNTTYYFYMGDRADAVATTIYGRVDGGAPGLAYADDANTAYAHNSNDFDHVLQGDVIPEPTTLALLGLGLAGAGIAKRRKRKA